MKAEHKLVLAIMHNQVMELRKNVDTMNASIENIQNSIKNFSETTDEVQDILTFMKTNLEK
jgi:prefoldin subunit 5